MSQHVQCDGRITQLAELGIYPKTRFVLRRQQISRYYRDIKKQLTGKTLITNLCLSRQEYVQDLCICLLRPTCQAACEVRHRPILFCGLRRNFRSDRSNRHFYLFSSFFPPETRRLGLLFSELHYYRRRFPGQFPSCLLIVDFPSSAFRRILWQKKRVDQMNRVCVRPTSYFFSGSNYGEMVLYSRKILQL